LSERPEPRVGEVSGGKGEGGIVGGRDGGTMRQLCVYFLSCRVCAACRVSLERMGDRSDGRLAESIRLQDPSVLRLERSGGGGGL